MRRFILSTLAALGVLGALAATTAATAEQASLSGMVGLAVAGLVVLLEVINVSGTWVWLTDTRRHVRLEAGVGVGVASLVTGLCGFLSFGPIGAVAPAGLLFAVHLVFRLNQPGQQDTVPSRVIARIPIVPASRPAVPDGGDGDGPETAPVPALSSVPTGEDTPLSSVPASEDEAVILALVRHPGKLPGVGAIAAEHRIGKDKATRYKTEALRRRGEAA